MWKAYLAYSSDDDKSFVEAVAQYLGRINVVFDKMYFKPGDAIESAIIQGIDKSKLFVFFASKSSLTRYWPTFEVDAAKTRNLRALTIVTDTSVTIADLPEWMRNWVVVSPAPSPIQTARMIKMRLIVDSDLEKQLPFVGREGDLQWFSTKLIMPPEQPSPRIIVISGLDGIGRRTFARRALRDYLSLDIGPVIILEETDSIDKLQWQLIEETCDSGSRAEVSKLMAEFQGMSLSQQAEDVAKRISAIGKKNYAPVIIDKGVLLDDYGRYSDQVTAILEALLKYKDTYLVLIHRRRPEAPADEEIKQGLAFYRLNPLKLEHTELLLQQRLRISGVKATSPQIRDLAIYMEGYPPSVELACNYAREYGLGTLLSDKATLIDFQVRTFAPIIDRFKLQQIEWDILKTLGSESTLPLEVLALILGKTEEELVPFLKHLIDLNLATPVDINFSIAAPVKEAVHKLRGNFTDLEYRGIGQKLLAKYWATKNEIPSLAIVDVTIHALANSDVQKLKDFGDLILPSQLLRVAKEAYDSKDWDKAIAFAKRTLSLDTRRDFARVILFKGYVRKEQWTDAEKELEVIRIRGGKGYFYDKGFFEWKRGHLPAAISAFKSALGAGDTSISVYRDLAHCLFRNAQVEEAKTTLNKAPQWIFRNSYVVDLAAQIAIAQKDPKAEEYISALEHVASPDIFHLRRSMFYAALGKLSEALEDAEAAVASNPSFQSVSQKADILIEMGNFADAEPLIDGLKSSEVMKRDVKIGLKCKLLLRQQLWREAEEQFKSLHDKEAYVARMTYRAILEKKVMDTKVPTDEREKAKSELKKIGQLLQIPLVTDDDDEAS